MKTVYTAAAHKTESVTYRKGQRERFEFGDIIVLRQPDLKRTVQIMRAANTYDRGGWRAARSADASRHTSGAATDSRRRRDDDNHYRYR